MRLSAFMYASDREKILTQCSMTSTRISLSIFLITAELISEFEKEKRRYTSYNVGHKMLKSTVAFFEVLRPKSICLETLRVIMQRNGASPSL